MTKYKILFFLLTTCTNIPRITVSSMPPVYFSAVTKSLHVCLGGSNPDILLQCGVGEVIVVEEAVRGWSSQYSTGTTICPRDTEECAVQFVPLVQRCQGLQQCTVPNSQIYTDLHKPQQCAGSSNYFDGRYLCLLGKNINCLSTNYNVKY